MTTMVFVRRRINRGMEEIARTVAGDDDLVVVSDERFLPGALWWGRYGRDKDTGPASFSDDEMSDIIRRCRMLRQLPRPKATQLVNDASRRWTDFLMKERIDRAIVLPVDAYITHVLVVVCRRLGIPIYSVSQTPFTNRMRFTVFGETVGENDDPLDELVDTIIQRFRNEPVRPAWLIGLDAAPWRVALRRLLFNFVRGPAFLAYRIASGDRDSYLYAPRRLQRYYMSPTVKRFLAALSLERKAARALPEDYAFLPLQFYPEATSDYWISEQQMHNHHEAVLAAARAAAKKMPVVVKEHPSAFARRWSGFLRELSSIPNVMFVPLGADISAILRGARFVIGQGSSTTFQAQVMGKQVLYLGTPYFDACSGSVILRDLSPDSIEAALSQILEEEREPSIEEIRRMVERFVRSTGTGSFSHAPLFEKSQQSRAEPFAGDDLRRIFEKLTRPQLADASAGELPSAERSARRSG